MTLYLQVTPDKYELPMYVADSAAELARKVGVTTASMHSMISRGNKNYKRVVIDECEDEDAKK